jgi:tryptophanyl-tRNA synthetase
VGLFTYPVLQAADVLLYRAHGVPVGEDQRQHIELMRDLGQRFNSLLGETFVLPEAWIPPAGARIMALDDPTQKMSKSDARPNSVIQIADSPDVIAKKIRVAVTDSGRDIVLRPDRPAIGNLLTIYSVVSGESPAAVEELFAGRGYGDFKAALSDLLIAALAPIRARYEELVADPAECARVLGRGAEKAHAVAADTMSAVRERVGVIPPP